MYIFFYFQLVVFTILCLNILHTHAGISNFLREAGTILQNNEGISNLLRDTGMVPDVPMNELVKTQ